MKAIELLQKYFRKEMVPEVAVVGYREDTGKWSHIALEEEVPEENGVDVMFKPHGFRVRVCVSCGNHFYEVENGSTPCPYCGFKERG